MTKDEIFTEATSVSDKPTSEVLETRERGRVARLARGLSERSFPSVGLKTNEVSRHRPAAARVARARALQKVSGRFRICLNQCGTLTKPASQRIGTRWR